MLSITCISHPGIHYAFNILNFSLFSDTEDKNKLDNSNAEDDDDKLDEAFWKDVDILGSADEIDLDEESQDVLSKEKAYLELKARRKQVCTVVYNFL